METKKLVIIILVLSIIGISMILILVFLTKDIQTASDDKDESLKVQEPANDVKSINVKNQQAISQYQEINQKQISGEPIDPEVANDVPQRMSMEQQDYGKKSFNCLDTDDEKNWPYTFAVCYDDIGQFPDYCIGTAIVDFYCTGSNQEKKCNSGYFICKKGCSNGACL